MKMRNFLLMLVLVAPPCAFADEEVLVPAGKFQMGCASTDKHCDRDEGPSGGVAVSVPAFRIDKHEVTVKDYRRCVEAGKCAAPRTKGNEYCNSGYSDRDNYPVNCVNWYDADAYCKFAGKRLPTEAEWERAARAGSGDTPYLWGDSASCKEAIFNDGHTRGSAKDEMDGCGEDRSFAVGSRTPNALGLFDMYGNIGEWVANWYTPDALTTLYASGHLDGPARGDKRVVRGGAWDQKIDTLRVSFRDPRKPDMLGGSLGIRCAVDAK